MMMLQFCMHQNLQHNQSIKWVSIKRFLLTDTGNQWKLLLYYNEIWCVKLFTEFSCFCWFIRDWHYYPLAQINKTTENTCTSNKTPIIDVYWDEVVKCFPCWMNSWLYIPRNRETKIGMILQINLGCVRLIVFQNKNMQKFCLQISCAVIWPIKHYIQRNILFQADF